MRLFWGRGKTSDSDSPYFPTIPTFLVLLACTITMNQKGHPDAKENPKPTFADPT